MAGLKRAASHPGGGLSPVPLSTSGPSGWLAFGLIAAVLVALVGLSLVEKAGGGKPGTPAAVAGPLRSPRTLATSTASAAPEPETTPSVTAAPDLPMDTPPPPVDVAVGAAPACSAGSTPDQPGPIDQARPPLTFFTPMAFDRRVGKIVAVAGGDLTGTQTWTFDVCTNTWTQMHPEREPGGWDGLVYDVDSDLTIEVDSVTRRVWAYDLAADTWTLKDSVPRTWQGRPRLAYDPVSGLVGALGGSELWTYDVEPDWWAAVRVVNPLGGGSSSDRRVFAYDASVDRFVAFTDATETSQKAIWLFDRHTGRWARSAASVPEIGFGYGPSPGVIAYDEATERTVVYSGRRMVAYHAATDSWETLWSDGDPVQPAGVPIGSTVRVYHTMVYDPINQRLVVYGGEHPTSDPTVWVGSDDVLAFDPATGQWMTLLGASTVQPIK